jgi:ferredoxin, 2Fe-2S
MPMITYVEHNGTTHMVASPIGISLMEAATMHKVPGIEGDCGGFCACGTCHCYVAAEDAARLPEMHELERATLDFAYDVDARSRLSCQIPVTEALDGIIVHLPARQY